MRHRHNHSKKVGLPPGSLVYTGEREKEPIALEFFSFSPDSYSKKTFLDTRDFFFTRESDTLQWLIIGGIHKPEIVERIGKMYGIDTLVMEDILNPSHRPKLDERENYLFIVLKMLTWDPDNRNISMEQISLVLGKDYLLTFQESSTDFFSAVKERLQIGAGKMRQKSIGYLAYSLLDTIIDQYFLVLEEVEESMDRLEGNLMDKPKKEYLNSILELQQQVILMKKVIFPITEITLKLTNEEGENFFCEDTRLYLKDLHDHSLMIYESIQNLGARFSNLSQLYHAALGSDTNEIMKVLTVMSAIFIPLTFIAGLYGMNFKNMPELEWMWGYYATLGLMGLIFITMLVYFKRKGWW